MNRRNIHRLSLHGNNSARLTIACALLMLFSAAGCPANQENKTKPEPPQPQFVHPERAGKRAIKLYFYDPQATLLVPVTRLIAGNSPMPETAFRELAAGPAGGSPLIKTIPDGTKLNASKIESGVMTLDWSPELTAYGGGSTMEIGLVQSILFTAGQFEEVSSVQFLIGGEKKDYLPEGTGIREPFPIPKWINDFGSGDEEDKFQAYLVIRGKNLLAPITISAADPAELYRRLKDPRTYGGVFDSAPVEIGFVLSLEGRSRVVLGLDKSLMDIQLERRAPVVRALACTVYNFVLSKPEFGSMKVTYNNEEAVSLFDVDLSEAGIAAWLSEINLEGE